MTTRQLVPTRLQTETGSSPRNNFDPREENYKWQRILRLSDKKLHGK